MSTHREVTQSSPASGAKPVPVPVQTMPLEKAKKLIRKTSSEHSELFRLLAK
jgi:hypothetical protein